MAKPDWEHLATFVEVTRAGSLSAGARQLGISQPTAGRHIGSLEAALGVTLFVRHSRGLSLTPQGTALFAEADELARRMEAMLRDAGDAPTEGSGCGRISAAEPIGGVALTPLLRQLRRQHPQLRFEIVIDNSPANLSQREADLAVRMFKPAQLDLVATRIGEVPLGMFATHDYLQAHGEPRRIGDLGDHTLIGHDRDPFWHRAVAELGLSSRDFGYRSDNLLAQLQAVRDSVGIGVVHVALAARDASLVRVLPELRLPALEMWLVMHRDLRTNLAVRTVFDELSVFLRQYVRQAA